MKDKLEGFIKENKKQFEVQGPSDLLWQKIANELDRKPKKKLLGMYQWMSIAALLVLSIGMYAGYQYRKLNGEVAIADINPVMGKKEVKFTSLIEEKRDSLQIFADGNPELYQKFTDDMNKLDSDYQALKKQLQTTPNKALVGKAMMKNLEIQVQTLSQQLYIINQVSVYNNNEKSI